MATPCPTTGQKRVHSLVDDDHGSVPGTAIMPDVRFILLHFNTLTAKPDNVARILRMALAEAAPDIVASMETELTDAAISASLALYQDLFTVLLRLGVRKLGDDELKRFVSAYSRLYDSENFGWELASGVPELLEQVEASRHREQDQNQKENEAGKRTIAVAVLSNNIEKAEVVLDSELALLGYVDAILPSDKLYNHTPTAILTVAKNPWEECIVPWYTEISDSIGNDDKQPLSPEQVLVVSCALYDLIPAQEMGVKMCWIKKADIDLEDVEAHLGIALNPDLVFNSLDELCAELFKERPVGAKKEGAAAEPEVVELEDDE